MDENKKKKKKIKKWPVVLLILLIIAGATIGYVVMKNKDDSSDSDQLVYIDSVASITGSGIASDNKYLGTVESQEVKYVDNASDKVVKEVYVKEGDTVKTGDKLFSYDTDDMNLKLKQMQLELTSINNSISTTNDQISQLAKEREQAPAEEKIDYTTQIQSLQAQINQYNYDASSKQLEIDKQNSAIENCYVYSPMDGIIKSVKSVSTSSSDDSSDTSSTDEYSDYSYDGSSDSSSEDSNHFISIMAVGDYRIKCTGDEMNVRSLSTDESMIVVSRTDETATWTGKISTIDLDNPVNSNNLYGGETTTKYAFYITLDSVDGLMLGQHVYAEMDYGQGAPRTGLWLYESYIVKDGDDAYVWADNGKGKIEKRSVTLGEYDETLGEYEIVSGLDNSDYIAYPENRIKSGMKTTKNAEDIMPEEVSDDSLIDDSMLDDIYYEDASSSDASYDDSLDDYIDESGETGDVILDETADDSATDDTGAVE